MQEHFLESISNRDILWKICDCLDMTDMQALLLTSKKMRAQFFNDNVFWKSQCKKHFPYFAPQNEPTSWFLAFTRAYKNEYYFSSSNLETNQKRAALFSAAKSDNKDQFKALFRDIPVKEASSLFDSYGYRCFDWLYRKNDQDLLDEVFMDKVVSANSDDLFHLAILCNQPDYLKTNASQFVCTKEHLSSAARLGSFNIINILLENCSFFVEEVVLLAAFEDAALCGRTDIIAFLHEEIIKKGMDINDMNYKNAMHNAFSSAMLNRHKATFGAIVEISKCFNFDVNHKMPYSVYIGDYVFHSDLTVIDFAAFQEDSTYLDLLVDPNANLNCNPVSIIGTISNNWYETLWRLLKKGAVFKFENVVGYCTTSSRADDMITGMDYIKLALKKTPDPRIDSLVKLTLYKDEIKNEWRTLWSIFLQWLGISRPQDKEQKSRASQALFNVIVGNTPVKKLDELPPIEKGALSDPGSRLNTIYKSFFHEIKRMQEDEEENQVLEKNGSTIDLHGVD